jgi:very-short-patch-repair endonuclease
MRFLYNNPTLKNRRRTLRKNQTIVESLLWAKLRRKQFLGLKFYRQYSIYSFIVDFYCPNKKLIIELDGSQHLEQKNKEYDIQRTKYLNQRGICVLRFWDNEVTTNLQGVLQSICNYINAPQTPS